MEARVTFCAQCDQIVFLVAARLAPKDLVVHLQVSHATAALASPAIAFQRLTMELTIALHIEPESRAFAAGLFHDVFPVTSERKIFCCGLGRNL